MERLHQLSRQPIWSRRSISSAIGRWSIRSLRAEGRRCSPAAMRGTPRKLAQILDRWGRREGHERSRRRRRSRRLSCFRASLALERTTGRRTRLTCCADCERWPAAPNSGGRVDDRALFLRDLAGALERWSSPRVISIAIVDISLGKESCYPLLEALMAWGLVFALATGRGQDGIDSRDCGRSTLRKPLVCDVRPMINEPMVQSASRRRNGLCGAFPGLVYLSDALIARSAFDPGHSSRSESSLSGRWVVLRISCSSLASSLI
jgi:hypothetical protein